MSANNSTLGSSHAFYNTLQIQQLEEDAGEPDHLPELLLRIDNTMPGTICTMLVVCVLLQVLQLYIINEFLDSSVYLPFQDIKHWVDEGLLEWSNGSNYDGYKDLDNINVLEYFSNGQLGLTDEGYKTSLGNIVFGVTLLLFFHVAEMTAVFCENEYHLKVDAPKDALRRYAELVILAFQVVNAATVIRAAAQSVLTNSLDTVETIEAALNAFFILEIDDKLLPVMWTCVKHKGILQLIVL